MTYRLVEPTPTQRVEYRRELYRFADEYVKSGRDPYLLETLQPDVRLAVKLLLRGMGELGGDEE